MPEFNPLILGSVTEASTGLLRFPNKSLVDRFPLSVLAKELVCEVSWAEAPNMLFPASGLLGLLKKIDRGTVAGVGWLKSSGWDAMGLTLPKRDWLCPG